VSLAARIEERLSALAPRSVELTDESGLHVGHEGAKSGSHFRLTIVSDRFAGMPRVQRHRVVYEALGPLMHTEIHALALRALTPDELATEKG
jgi:BolA family transcriptional regulator, general stress-responsive regulator